jgi:hypothetical protein
MQYCSGIIRFILFNRLAYLVLLSIQWLESYHTFIRSGSMTAIFSNASLSLTSAAARQPDVNLAASGLELKFGFLIYLVFGPVKKGVF